MKHIFTSSLMAALAAAALASCTSSELTRFAVTDMTWAEFYAGEVGVPASELESNGYDAVTSATAAKTKRFSGHNVSEDGAHIYGPKDVAVAMTESTFKKLSDQQKARFTFVEDSTFCGYKVMEKKGAFGPYISPVVSASDVTATISSGSSSNYGNYTVSLRGLKAEGTYHGILLCTDDGSRYGLKTLDNIWLNSSELAFSVADFTEPHGNKPSFKHTSTIAGKTITNIVYIMSGKEAISVEADLYVKNLCDAKISIAEQAAGKDLKVKVEGLPEGYWLASVRSGAGRMATPLSEDQYSFENGTLTLIGDVAPGSFRVQFQSEDYTDLGASFEVK